MMTAGGPNRKGGNARGKPKEKSQATKLVEMALRDYDLGVSPDGKTFAYTQRSPHIALGLKSAKFGLRQRLAREYYRKYNAACGGSALKDCLNTLEGMALEKSPTPLHLRTAGNSEAVYIDMADAANRVIEIRDGTWSIEETAPYMFRRTDLTRPLIEPIKGGRKLSKLWQHVNIDPLDRPLLLAVLVDALVKPSTSKPVTGFLAEHGSAKTTTAKRVVELIDPSIPLVRCPPKDLDTWVVAASGSWAVALDNLSSIPEWLSDAICRASTGDGNVKRELYSDDELSVFNFRRCVIITGIDVGGLNGDLADRLMPIKLHAIEKRLSETELEAQWEADRAAIFGGLLSFAAKVHRKLPTAEQVSLPRMADFGQVLWTIDTISGSDGVCRYRDSGKQMMSDSAQSNSFVSRMIEMGYDTGDSAQTANQILRNVVYTNGAAIPVDWPKKPRAVTTLLNKHAPAMRLLGWTIVNDEGKNKECVIKWTIRPPHQKKE